MSYDATKKPAVPTFHQSVAEYLALAAAAAAKYEKHLLALDPMSPWPLKEAQESQAHLADAVALLGFHSLRARGEYPEYSASDPATSYTCCLAAVRQMLLDGGALAQGLAHLQRLEVAGQVRVSERDRAWMVLYVTQCADLLHGEIGRIFRIAAHAAATEPPKSVSAPSPSQPPIASTDGTSLDLSDIPAALLQTRGNS